MNTDLPGRDRYRAQYARNARSLQLGQVIGTVAARDFPYDNRRRMGLSIELRRGRSDFEGFRVENRGRKKPLIDLKTKEPLKNREEKKKEYDDNPENKLKRKEREQKPEYKLKKKEYDDNPENKLKRKEREQKPEYKLKKKEYDDNPENKLKRKERKQKPEYKLKAKEYRDDPENKARAKKYKDDPENKLKAKEREQKPEYKLKRKEYKKRRKIEHIKQQLKFPPPLGFNAPCATCPREKSRGWMRAIKAHKLLSRSSTRKV